MTGLYVHVPFCTRRCGYCDFNTYALDRAPITPEDWAWGIEMEVWDGTVGPFDTVFFGGGTPSLLGAPALAKVLDGIRGTVGLEDGLDGGDGVAPGAEVTVEANPETVTPELLDGLLAAGVTRLSLGMQSSDEAVLATLDRLHTPGQALRSVELARAAGFTDISLDLIYGTPGESLASWQATLESALSSGPDHVSCYALIVERGTPLAKRIERGELAEPDDDLMADEYILADELLTAAGLGWYELSNWAKPGHQCRHNLGYWQGVNYYGVGPGAHSYHDHVFDKWLGNTYSPHRWWNHRSPERWIGALRHNGSPAARRERIDAVKAHEERVLLELRLATGLPLDALTPTERARVPSLVADGLATTSNDHLTLTLKGRLLADKVTLDLLD